MADKNSKEQFIKKLQLCMKTYDYKDEQKDVKGKVSLGPSFISSNNKFLKSEPFSVIQ